MMQSSQMAAENPSSAASPTSCSDLRPSGSDENYGRKPAAFDIDMGVKDTAPRQVIAVSASKGPAAFFNLARKFLVTDEECDLSALEGAIVSALDAAHLLERSQLASIVKVQTSYVAVEPKRRKQQTPHAEITTAETPSISADDGGESFVTTPTTASTEMSASLADQTYFDPYQPQSRRQEKKAAMPRTKELRRARIIITVRRTENYEKWLSDNPLGDLAATETGDLEKSS